MRHVIASLEFQIATSLLLILLLVLILLQPQPQLLFYPLAREAAKAKMNHETREMEELETAHFVIKYTKDDADDVNMVARAAEEAYQPVTSLLGYVPKKKALIVIYPTKEELRRAFGWSGNESAMGVYWGGAIQLLSPKVWFKGNSTADFIKTGPMVHEFTHLVFDYMTNGNYSRWFTEGLAQYVEYKVNDYEWLTPENNLARKQYSMRELDEDFDKLSNQSLAYRESLTAVRYIAEARGENALKELILELKDKKTLPQALKDVLGLDYTEYETNWKAWGRENMVNYEE